MRLLISAVAGLVFGFGLVVSQMTDPARVLGFFDVAGNWDPALAFVMGGAVPVMMIAWAWIGRRERAFFGAAPPPPSAQIDARLVGGAALFGLGWGLTGLCPAPAIAGISFGGGPLLAFLAALVIGLLAPGFIAPERGAAAPDRA